MWIYICSVEASKLRVFRINIHLFIFNNQQTIIGRIFWSLVLILLFSLGLYWCAQSYQNWKNNPVLTTITTTTFSINEVKGLIWSKTKIRRKSCAFTVLDHRKKFLSTTKYVLPNVPKYYTKPMDDVIIQLLLSLKIMGVPRNF